MSRSERAAWVVLASVAMAAAGVFAFMWARTEARIAARETAEREDQARAEQARLGEAAQAAERRGEARRRYAEAKAEADRIAAEELRKFRQLNALREELRKLDGDAADAVRDFATPLEAADPPAPGFERPEPANLRRTVAARYIQRARRYVAGGRLDEAAAALDRAAELWPDHGDIPLLRAQIQSARAAHKHD